ncbi:hypothetical protein OTB20_12685 [Streptomyces sp. H27-H1]|uniref:hypothetical protein n=1 Tax=Streptomyces sp. H27-H1 TaxID=2996461 RepID=UPI002271C470|nr:hypothetical protein [Streptomyces sp. H27-H1]MCY0927042.1 hypothetical protein [Streptomyces sp. H27-H1]
MLTTASSTAGDVLALRIPTVLRTALGTHWEFTVDGPRIEIQHPHRGTPYRPPRRPPSWKGLLHSLQTAFADTGAPRDDCLPLRWGRDTELTISAVQALDPLLKDGRPQTYRQGFLPQPVVRFTGERDASGDLCDGFLTSFVNVSRVQPIERLDEYGNILDGWLSVLSQLGFHARHMSARGTLTPWRRREVAGITLHFRHLGLDLGDIVLLWNADDPTCMAVDLGTGLERLAWARTQQHWPALVYGRFAEMAPPATLDAVRTATLLLGHGINPAPRGAGGVTRRVIGTIDPDVAHLGVSAIVREAFNYWSHCGVLRVPWPTIAGLIEEELRR